MLRWCPAQLSSATQQYFHQQRMGRAGPSQPSELNTDTWDKRERRRGIYGPEICDRAAHCWFLSWQQVLLSNSIGILVLRIGSGLLQCPKNIWLSEAENYFGRDRKWHWLRKWHWRHCCRHDQSILRWWQQRVSCLQTLRCWLVLRARTPSYGAAVDWSQCLAVITALLGSGVSTAPTQSELWHSDINNNRFLEHNDN